MQEDTQRLDSKVEVSLRAFSREVDELRDWMTQSIEGQSSQAGREKEVSRGRLNEVKSQMRDEGYEAFKVGRAKNEVAIEDLTEILLSISLASKDAMLDWEWFGIDLVEWPPQRLDWEISRIEHLACAMYMESTWLSMPWHTGFAALRGMACLVGSHSMHVQYVHRPVATSRQ